MLEEILESISEEWSDLGGGDRNKDVDSLAVFVDEGVAEMLKWSFEGLVSDGVAEMLKWSSDGTGAGTQSLPLFPLELSVEGQGLLALSKPRRVLFLVSGPLLPPPAAEGARAPTADSARDLVFAALRCAASLQPSAPPDALLLTTSSLELLDLEGGSGEVIKSHSSSSSRAPQLYNKTARPLLPCRWLQAGGKDSSQRQTGTGAGTEEIKVLFLDRHCFHLLSPPSDTASPARQQKLGLFLLASAACRDVCPLSLHQLGAWDPAVAGEQSVAEAVVEDLTPPQRATLKHLAHEIAAASVFDLGLDPTSSIFTMGKTSALVGHTLQQLLEGQLEERRQRALVLEQKGQDAPAVCRSATLLLVDRSCDLFSPSQHDGAGPLVHRILSMLPRQALPVPPKATATPSSLTDIALLQEPQHCPAGDSVPSELSSTQEVLVPPVILPSILNDKAEGASCSSVMQSPLSALSQLALPLVPSISPPFQSYDSSKYDSVHDRNALFMHAMFAQSEDRGRDVLAAALQELAGVQDDSLVNPRKGKKGLGAEMLGLVSSAVAAHQSSSDMYLQVSYSPGVVHEHAGLLSWATAVIEGMQRSSNKQLTSHLCKNIGDTASSVGHASFELRAQLEGEILSRLLEGGTVTLSRVVQDVIEVCGLQPSSAPEEGAAVVEVAVKDVKHTLLLALSVCAMLGREGVFRIQDPLPELSDFLPLAQALAAIIVDESAVGDILDLQLMALGVVDDIIDFRRKVRRQE